MAGATEGADNRLEHWGSRIFAPTGTTAVVQLRRLPRRHERHGRRRAVRDHRPGHRRVSLGQLERSGAEHRALPVRPRRDLVHHHLRASGDADVGVGPRRRRPAERAAGGEPDRVHRVDPDPPRGVRSGGGGRSAVPDRAPSHRAPGGDRSGCTAVRRGRRVRQLRRSAVQPRDGERQPTAAPAATRPAGAGATRASPARVRSDGTSPPVP